MIIIANPNSRNYKNISQIDLDCDIYLTTKPGDATKISKKFKNKKEIIIAAGGDGTIHEVINGMYDGNAKLGIIPLGTENIISKVLNINLKNSIKIIKNKQFSKFDLGKANNNYFILCSGIGFDSETILNVNKKLKKYLGGIAYIISGIKTMFKTKNNKIIIKTKTKEYNGYFVLINNFKAYGWHKHFTIAKPYDGLLDIIIFKKKLSFKYFKYLITPYFKSILKDKNVIYLKEKEFTIISKSKKHYHLDAEVKGTTPITYKCEKNKINIIHNLIKNRP